LLQIRQVRKRQRTPVQDHPEYAASGGFDLFLDLARCLPRGEAWLNDQNNAIG
jgi:hypothetical protein